MAEEIGFDNPEKRRILSVVRSSHLFQGLSENEHRHLSGKFRVQTLQPGEELFAEGDRGSSFYFVMSGQLTISRRVKGEEQILSTIVRGDFFGEGALLNNRPRRATVRAQDDAEVIRMDRVSFFNILRSYPDIKQELQIVSKGYDIARTRTFNWLAEEEGLHLVARKHSLVLVLNLLPATLLGSVGLTLTGLGPYYSLPALTYAGIATLVVALGWAIWRYLDWGNDYYIVTDQRVVWLEKIILLYESVQEAKLTEVRSVDISTDLLQRIFNFGDIHVRTYTGVISMRNIATPHQFKALIEEYWKRAVETARAEENIEIDRRLREKIGLPIEKKKKRGLAAEPEPGPEPPPKGKPFSETVFTNFFKMRYVQGDTIVYRKHWFLLLITVWKPTLSLATLLGLGTYLLVNYPNRVLTALYILLLIGLLGWWVYQYWDWRDDRYELTKDSFTDLDRTPLGRENRQTAPLENILSLEHERVGILGILLNFGTVSINVGDKTYEFEGVHNPAQVRQEVSDRQQARKHQVERDRVIREEERQMEWLARYHRNASELWAYEERELESEEDDYELK
jgi:uncharacterized membrane protein YdbT with pleckstrin-like domain